MVGFGYYYQQCLTSQCFPTIVRSHAKPRISNGSPRNSSRKSNLKDELTKQLIRINQKTAVNFVDYNSIVAKQAGPRFDFAGSDVMVFLHIQKTGGSSFERHLVEDINLEHPCQPMGDFGNPRRNRKKKKRKKLVKKLYSCLRPGNKQSSWLFSRFSTGWKCGLHADWTELTECVDSYLDASEGVDNRRYFYMTFLREPVARYVSEFLHVQRGATWSDTQYMCGGESGLSHMVPCYESDDWEGVSLDQFNGCTTNMAFNRQTRMLADLRLVHCYNDTAMPARDRDRAMLASAKANLRNMAFFGMTARQAESQLLFEQTFKLKFKVDFETEDQQSESYDLTREETQRIRQLNSLDIELYNFALDLLQERYQAAVKSAETAVASIAA